MRSAVLVATLSAVLATSAFAQLGSPQGSIGKSSAPPKGAAAPVKAPTSAPAPSTTVPTPPANVPTASSAPKGPGQADLRIVKVEHKVVMQGCKANAPFAEVVATVKNKGGAPSAGLNDPSAVAAVFKVDGAEQRFPAAGGLMPLPPDGTQVVVMKVPYNEGLFPVEKLPDGWIGRKSATAYFIQVNAAGLIDEAKVGDKGVMHEVKVTQQQCPDLYHTLPPIDAFVQFQNYCQKLVTQGMLKACATQAMFAGAILKPEQMEAAKKLPQICNACKASCPSCGYPAVLGGIGGIGG